MAPPPRTARGEIAPTGDHDLDLDLRPPADPILGYRVVDFSAPMRPTRPRRSSRSTHVRLVAALARIHADVTAAPDTGGDRGADLDLTAASNFDVPVPAGR